MPIRNPTGLDVAAQVDPNILRPWTMGDLITFSNSSTGGALFKDNVRCYFGDASDASIYYDATDLIIEPQLVGAGIVKLGSASDRNVMLGKIGLGTSTISSTYWINFIQTTSALIQGLPLTLS
jgi:hypothetical protein